MISHTITVLTIHPLFAIFAAAMLMHAFSDSPSGVSIRFRSNGSLFNVPHLRSQSKCMTTLLHKFQYADDCTLTADSEKTLQNTIDSIAHAACSFFLTMNCKQTEVRALQNSAVRNPSSLNGPPMANVHSFKYLCSTVTDDCQLDTKSIAEYNVQLPVLLLCGLRMTFLPRQRYKVSTTLQLPQH